MVWIAAGILLMIGTGALYREFGRYISDVSPDNFAERTDEK